MFRSEFCPVLVCLSLSRIRICALREQTERHRRNQSITLKEYIRGVGRFPREVLARRGRLSFLPCNTRGPSKFRFRRRKQPNQSEFASSRSNHRVTNSQ